MCFELLLLDGRAGIGTLVWAVIFEMLTDTWDFAIEHRGRQQYR